MHPCAWCWKWRHAFKGFVQLHPVFPDEVAVVFAEPQHGVLRQVVWALLRLDICAGRFRPIGHTIALRCKGICRLVQAALCDVCDLMIFIPLCRHSAAGWSHRWPSLLNPDRWDGTDCRPTCQKPSRSPRRRPLSGRWPSSSHGGPTAGPQTRRGQGAASPGRPADQQIKQGVQTASVPAPLSLADLDVGVHIHKGPLAVLAVDAEGQLHLLVEQDTHLDSLFLQGKVQRGTLTSDRHRLSGVDVCLILKNKDEAVRVTTALRFSISSSRQ